MHSNSRLMFRKHALEYFSPSLRVLEIGPDGFPSSFQKIVANRALSWDTLDIHEDPRLTYAAHSEYVFPIPDDSYDVILSGQVIEHVRKIWVWIKELARVCKGGGLVITVNPVSWPYHKAPIDCWRAYPEGMRALYEEASLEVIRSEWASLEALRYPNRLPGRSAEWQPRALRIANRALGWLGYPVECAYDTITIGRKVSTSGLRNAPGVSA
jgi:SAM-dependent methyltransferase